MSKDISPGHSLGNAGHPAYPSDIDRMPSQKKPENPKRKPRKAKAHQVKNDG